MRCLAALSLALLSAPAIATTSETQAWLSMSANGTVSGKLLGSGEMVLRGAVKQRDLASAEVTASLGTRVSKHATIFAGVGLSRVYVAGGTHATLHRGRKQLNLDLGKLGRAAVTTRTMAEERWWLNRGGAGVRLRQQVRIAQPVGHGKLQLFVSGEAFLNLNSTDWGQNAGLNRLRSSFGLSVPVTPHLRADVGLLDDHDFRHDRTDREIRAALMVLAYRF